MGEQAKGEAEMLSVLGSQGACLSGAAQASCQGRPWSEVASAPKQAGPCPVFSGKFHIRHRSGCARKNQRSGWAPHGLTPSFWGNEDLGQETGRDARRPLLPRLCLSQRGRPLLGAAGGPGSSICVQSTSERAAAPATHARCWRH